MAMIFDNGLLERREQQTLTPTDLCKMALCAALAQALPQATVYSSAQAQGVTQPAVFVRFGRISVQKVLGELERITLSAECRYLPDTALDDGECESERAMQAMLDAMGQLSVNGTDFFCTERAARRTADGAVASGEIRFEVCRKDVLQQAQALMQVLTPNLSVKLSG